MVDRTNLCTLLMKHDTDYVVSRHDAVDNIVHRVVGRDDLSQVIKSLLHDAEERGVNV